ncbi:DMT family transporter [Lysinibacillus sp. NPDC096418]|uniref:DMT family transporter n=1 Tax=Lysinibacillus sp. NPDC096418 TaxID=3364138 RepID=UPI003814EA3A
MSIQGKANSLMVIVTMFWGLSYTFMVMGLETLEVYNVVALRCLIAFFVAGLIFYKRMIKVNVKTLGYAAIQGFLLFLLFSLSLFGLETTSASNAGFILSLTVVLVPIMSSSIEKKLPSRAVRLAIICTMIGIAILTVQGSFEFRQGDILMAIAALGYSIYLVLNSTFTRSVESISYGVYQLGFAGLYALVFTILFETPTLPNTTMSWLAILGLGLVCSAFCFIGQTVAQQYTSPTHTGLIFSLEPIFAAMFAIMFLGEGITTKLILGGGFILIGNLVAQFEQLHIMRFIKKPTHEKAI